MKARLRREHLRSHRLRNRLFLAIPSLSRITLGAQPQNWLIFDSSDIYNDRFSPILLDHLFRHYPWTGLSEALYVYTAKPKSTTTSYTTKSETAKALLGDQVVTIRRRVVHILKVAICGAANSGSAVQSDWAPLLISHVVQSAYRQQAGA